MSASVPAAVARGAEHGSYEQGHQWNRVEYGAGCVAGLESELRRLGLDRPFLLSTRSVARHPDLLDAVSRGAGDSFVGAFTECRAHVPEDVAVAAAQAVEAAHADGIVAVGGSSVIDTGKAVALLLAERLRSQTPFATLREGGGQGGEAPALPQVAIPTTLSGGEFTGVVATTDADGVKHLLLDARLAPRSILLDPELTVPTPTALWRATGIKTLSDAIEQICFGATPATDALCARAIEFFLSGLPDGESLDARLRCQQAAWMSLFGLHDATSSVGLGAALRHQVAVTCGAGHGEVTCVLLPHVVRFNAAAAADRAAVVAPAFGLAADGDGARAWEAVAQRLEGLIRDLGLPTRLAEIVAREADLEALAERVLNERAAQLNPRRASAAEVVELLRGAW
jgi:alcohol dehydrogenase class IV